jgi:hypothetical protein
MYVVDACTLRASVHLTHARHPPKPSQIEKENTDTRVRDQDTKCCLCVRDNTKRERSEELLRCHPLVPKDGQGKELGICDGCLTIVVERRKKAKEEDYLILEKDTNEEVCAVCGDAATTNRPLNLTCCSGDDCPRSYCNNCLVILLNEAQLEEMQKFDEWSCPRCVAVAKARPKQLGGGAQSKPSPPGKPRVSKKPKRQQSLPPPGEHLPPVETQRDVVDYMAAYIRSTQTREANGPPWNPTTEDACFCCKDGGDLIECDCNRFELSNSPRRPPRTARAACRCAAGVPDRSRANAHNAPPCPPSPQMWMLRRHCVHYCTTAGTTSPWRSAPRSTTKTALGSRSPRTPSGCARATTA